MIESALPVLVIIFMIGSLAGVGLTIPAREAAAPLSRPGFVARVLVANWVVPPLTAWVLLSIISLDPAYGTGLLLLALAPCAHFAPALVAIAGGRTASMAAVLLTCIVTTVVVMPVALPRMDGGLPADFVTIAAPLVAFILVPLLGGMAVSGAAPRLTDRLRKPVAFVTSATGIVALVLVGIVHGRGMLSAVGSRAVLTQVLFLCAITAAAHAIGRGLDERERRTLTVCTSTRNLGAALAPLAVAGADARAIVMVAIAVPTTIAIATAVARWFWLDDRSRRPLPHAR